MNDWTSELSLMIAIYIAPCFVAGARGHHQRLAIIVTCLLTGWTGIGWIIALVWACTAVQPITKVQNQPSTNYDEVYARERARLDHLDRVATPPPVFKPTASDAWAMPPPVAGKSTTSDAWAINLRLLRTEPVSSYPSRFGADTETTLRPWVK